MDAVTKSAVSLATRQLIPLQTVYLPFPHTQLTRVGGRVLAVEDPELQRRREVEALAEKTMIGLLEASQGPTRCVLPEPKLVQPPEKPQYFNSGSPSRVRSTVLRKTHKTFSKT